MSSTAAFRTRVIEKYTSAQVEELIDSLSSLTIQDTKLHALPSVSPRFRGFKELLFARNNKRVSELFSYVKGNFLEIPCALAVQLYMIGATITKLSLRDCSLDESQLRLITTLFPNLVKCRLVHSVIAPKTLRAFQLCPELRHVNLSCTRGVDKAAIVDLVTAAPQLTALYLKHTQIVNGALEILASNLPHLQKLDIGSTCISNPGLSYLSSCKKLEKVNIALCSQRPTKWLGDAPSFSALSDNGIIKFCQDSPQTHVLDVFGCKQFSKQALGTCMHSGVAPGIESRSVITNRITSREPTACAALAPPTRQLQECKGLNQDSEELCVTIVDLNESARRRVFPVRVATTAVEETQDVGLDLFFDVFIDSLKSQFYSWVMCEVQGDIRAIEAIDGAILLSFDDLQSDDITLRLSGFTLTIKNIFDMYHIFFDLQVLFLENMHFEPGALKGLEYFQNLRYLSIKGSTGIQGQSIQLPKLERLVLCDMDISDKELELIKCPKLWRCSFMNCPSVTQVGISILPKNKASLTNIFIQL